MPEQDRIAGEQGRDDRVHCREIRIVPGSDGEHDPHGVTTNESPKTLLFARAYVTENLGRDRDHVSRTLFEAADLTGALGDRTPHLPRDLLRNRIAMRDEGVDGLG